MKREPQYGDYSPGKIRSKFWKVMRLQFFFFLLTLAQLHAIPARTQQRVTITVEEVTIEKFIKEVERQAGCVVIYNNDQLRDLPHLSLQLSGVTAEEALKQALRGSSFTCQWVEDFLVITRASFQAQPPRKVEGKVVDADGLPIPGATVRVKGTTTGAAANKDGVFSLSLPATGEYTLIISSVGMQTREVEAIFSRPLTIVLEEEVYDMTEVVVTGIFTKARESYTGAVTTITAEELKDFGNRSILSTIRNIDPGFNIMDNIEYGSDPNYLPDITLRGRSIMDANVRELQDDQAQRGINAPLFIVDGFEVSLSRVMDMDDQQVESVTILKDASATALYGARGANGIVVITTKRPPEGEIRFTYRLNFNVEAPDFSSYNLMNAREKLAYEQAAGIYKSSNPSVEQAYMELYNQRLVEVERGVDTYWLKYPTRVGFGQRHSLRAEGGNKDFKYAGSIGYNNITGTMKQSFRNTLTASLLFQYEFKKLKFMNDLSLGFNNTSDSHYGDFFNYTKLNPYYTPYDEEGKLKKMLDSQIMPDNRNLQVGNPLYDATLPARNTTEYTQLHEKFSIEWNITPDLFARGRFGITKQLGREDDYLSLDNTTFESLTGEEYKRRGSYDYTNKESLSYEGDLTLNYSKVFRDRHLLNVGLSYSLAEKKEESLEISAEGFAAANMGHLGMAAAYAEGGKPTEKEAHSRRTGGIINLNYTYDHRYFADVSGKLEGSSMFGSNDRIAPFWSAGIGWNAHHEDFVRENDIFSCLRFRLSYGTTGAQTFNPYQALMTFRFFDQENYYYWRGAYLLGIGNPDLTWQKTDQLNAGVEITLKNNRLRLNVDFYDKLTEDMLTDINIPTASGFNSYKANVGKVRNRGIEASALFYLINDRGRDLTWSVSGTLAHNRNEILEISNSLAFLNELLLEQSGSNPSFLFKEGESMNTIYAVRSLGIDPANGNELFLRRDGSKTYTWEASEKVACGVNEPVVWGSFGSKLRYKGLSLNLVFGYRTGGYSYNQTLVDKVENHDPWNNGDRRVFSDRWKTPGDHAYFKSVTNTSRTEASSRFVMKENTLECRTINVDYEFNPAWIRRNLALEYLSMGVYAEDLFRSSTIRQERGLYYPFARKFSFSLSARF
ncbi:MAG: SusC/RagA family TonB-linked outer membrane protein [Odoribacteraceae bacterium]|jgi:TonB-linked SusC/RagA family outer membrane protein|nr:SusC/RagA family TonB-linked outer membrane protein [Odoribacteraceae bacterium]